MALLDKNTGLKSVMAGVAAIGFMSTSALAQTTPQPVKVAANETVEVVPASATVTPQVDVPFRDARGVGLEGVQGAAASRSRDGTVVVYYGTNFEVFSALRDGLRNVVDKNEVPLMAFYLADPQEEVNSDQYHILGSERLEVYGHGVRSTLVSAPDTTIGNKIDDLLHHAYHPKLSESPSPTLDRG